MIHLKFNEQNKNTSAIWGRIASGFAACFLLFSLVSVPSVFADDSFSSFDSDLTFDVTDSSFLFSSYRSSPSDPSINNLDPVSLSVNQSLDFRSPPVGSTLTLTCTNGTIYPFFLNSNMGFYVASPDSDASFSVNGWGSYNMVNHDDTYDLYWTSSGYAVSGITSENANVPVYSSLANALYNISDFLDSSSSGGFSYNLQLTVPTGTIAYISLPSGLESNRIWLNSSTRKPFSSPYTDNRQWGFVDSLPSGSFSLPIAGLANVRWNGYGSPSLFGGYTHWKWSVEASGQGGRYFVICNPTYPSDSPDYNNGAAVSNNAIEVNIDNAISYKIYPLTSSWDNGQIVTDSGSDLNWSGDYDPDSGSWVNTPSDPDLGIHPVGGNSVNTTNSIHDWLENIANTISGFFNGAIGAVSTLVAAGSSFVGVLQGLYTWLPPAVYSVLTSALVLVITIGVIKVFI